MDPKSDNLEGVAEAAPVSGPTPGPWTAAQAVDVSGEAYLYVHSRAATTVASVTSLALRGVSPEAVANAALIAAAPELLAAVESAHRSLCGCASGMYCGAPDLRAAIAKARALTSASEEAP